MGFFSDLLRPRAAAQTFSTTELDKWDRLREGSGTTTISGETVSRLTSLELSAVYACVKIIGEDNGSQPNTLMRRTSSTASAYSTFRRETQDRRWRIVHEAPNPDMGAGDFQEALSARAALQGMSAAFIERDSKGAVRAMWPFKYDDTIRVAKTEGSRRTVFMVKEGSEPERERSIRDIFVLRGFSFDGRTGDPILERARQLIGLGLSAQRYAAEFLKNDPGADLFLINKSVHGVEKQKEVFKAVLAAWRSGGVRDWLPEELRVRQRGDPRILFDDTTVTRSDPDLEKQQLIQTRIHQIEEVARVFRVPLHKLAHLERVTFNNIEELQIDYDSSVMNPWRRRWSEACYRHLLSEEEQRAGLLYFDLQAEGMLRGRFRDQAEGWAKLAQAGIYAPNKILQWLKQNPVPGGDEPFIGLNMRQLSKVAAAAVTPASVERRQQ